jgi:glycosyltransferase involved in cell wall biosynthesis
LLSPLPYGTFRYFSSELESALRGVLGARKVDAVICDDIYPFRNIPESARHCVLMDKQDVTCVVFRRLLSRMRNPFKLAYGWLEYWKVRRWEALVMAQSAGALVCSETDQRIFQAMIPGVPMTVAPNVIDMSSYTPAEGEEPHTVLYLGAMDYFANQDGVEFFIPQILPELKNLVPDVKLVVAGRNPPEWLLRRYSGLPGVEFTGTIPDMQAQIAKAALCVVPLRIGSGTRLKILEAAAMTKPTVSTRIGAEGLDFVDGEEIILADLPQDFARAVAALLDDPARRQQLGQAARRRVELQYGLPALRAGLRTAMEKFGAQPAQPRWDEVAHGVRS